MIAARATNAGSKKSTGSHRSGTAGTNERDRKVTETTADNAGQSSSDVDIMAKIRLALPDARVTLQDLTGTEDHWKATIVSAGFAGKSLLERHRIVL